MRDLKTADIGQSISNLYRFKTKDQRSLFIEVIGHKYELGNRKKTKCFVLSGRLKDQGELNLTFLESCIHSESLQLDFIARISKQGHFLYVPEGVFSPFKVGNQDLYGKCLMDFLQPSSKTLVQKFLESSSPNDQVIPIETLDSNVLWLNVFHGTNPNASSLFVRISTSNTNISFHPQHSHDNIFALNEDGGHLNHINTLNVKNHELKVEIKNLES